MKWNHVLSTIWNTVTSWVRRESVAATALVQAFIALGIAFAWWSWSNAQTGAVIGIVSALLGMFVRSQVTPVARTRQPRRVQTAGGPAEPPPTSSAPHTGPPEGPGTRPL